MCTLPYIELLTQNEIKTCSYSAHFLEWDEWDKRKKKGRKGKGKRAIGESVEKQCIESMEMRKCSGREPRIVREAVNIADEK